MADKIVSVKRVTNTGPKRFKTLPDTYYVPVIDGKELNLIAETADVAMLLGIERKHDGMNSQFIKYACRMLKIESAWAE